MDEKINGSDESLNENEVPKNDEISKEISTNGCASETAPDSVSEIVPESESESKSENEPEGVLEAAQNAEPEAKPESTAEDVSASTPAQYAFKWEYGTQTEHNAREKKKNSVSGAATYAIVVSAVFAAAFLMLALFVIFGNQVKPTIVYDGTASVESIVAQQALPTTVLISTGTSYGSGFVISDDGYVVTNHHVIDDALDEGKVQVSFQNGKECMARIIGSSENDDLAVIKMEGSGFITSRIGSSADLVVGEQVVAVGNPGGTAYPFTVTSGIVSALNRDIKLFDTNNIYQRSVKAIQFSAAVNSGNSGGPLLNRNGEVIGVVTLKSGSDYDGIGFALPIDESMVIVREIIENGNVDGIDSPLSTKRPMLGITAVGVAANNWYIFTNTDIQRIPEEKLEMYPNAFYVEHTGVLVTAVSKGTGAEGKLKAMDIILKINGQTVTDVARISYVLSDKKSGDTVAIDFARGDEIRSVKIVLS